MRGLVKAVLAPRRVWPVLWAGVILVLTLMPGNDVPKWPWAELIHLDKIVHFVLFGVLAWLTAGVFIHRNSMEPQRAVLIALVLAVLYGGLIELMQGWMDMGRSADVWDLMVDAMGASVALLLALVRWRTPATM
ncbi:MAG: VanZ family protein [Flavobacteriales bacterium]|nr:VanZ family protein [Flavobacteriales bacterium]